MRRSMYSLMALMTIALVSTTMSAAASDATSESQAPAIDPEDFVSEIDNPYFPLHSGTTFVYRGVSDGESEYNTVVVTVRKKLILGVETTVVRDMVWVDGELAEKTYDWYAQDRHGNVWYFGEYSQEWENGQVVSTDGSWKAGVDGARPGITMLADPRPGDIYRQEYYAGEAEDMAKVIRRDTTRTVPYGSFDNVLVTREWTPLEPGVAEKKFYAPCIGNVAVTQVQGGHDFLKLISIRTAGNVNRPGCDD